jgi:hypothetical protein
MTDSAMLEGRTLLAYEEDEGRCDIRQDGDVYYVELADGTEVKVVAQ